MATLEDLDDGIIALRSELGAELENLTPDRQVMMKAGKLSSLLLARYTRTSMLEDLNSAIKIDESIIPLLEDDAMRMGMNCNLASKLGRRFERCRGRQPEDLSRAVQILQEVLKNTGLDNKNRAKRTSGLSELFRQKFLLQTGNMDDFNRAFELAEDAYKSTPAYQLILHTPEGVTPALEPAHCEVLNTFAIRLCERHERTGSGRDLDRSITILDHTVSAVKEHPFRPNWLRNLNVCLRKRYDITLAGKDITRGIKVCNMALKDLGVDHIYRAFAVSGLGLWYGKRYEHRRASLSISNATLQTLMGIDALHPAGTDDTKSGTKFDTNEASPVEDLNRAISLLKEAEDLARTRDPVDTDSGMHLMNLGHYLHHRALHNSDMKDLDYATEVLSKARDTTDNRHPNHVLQAWLLAMCEDTAWRLGHKTQQTFQNALTHYRIMLDAEAYTPLIHRAQAGRMCFDLCSANKDWSSAFAVAKKAIRLLPKLTSRSLEVADKQFLLGNKHITRFASDAAAVALQARQDPYIALEFLETGRGVLASSVEELRVDVHTLRKKHPDLAEAFNRLRDQLSIPHDLDVRQYDTNKQMDDLLQKIRDQEGLERFLLSPSPEEMRRAAKHGPIVTINASQLRCDAFIIRDCGEVEVVPLTNLEYAKIEEQSRSDSILRSTGTLVWLWNNIAKPVLDALGYTQPLKTAASKRRVWWIATGLLSKFPIHAAGLHLSEPNDSVLDRTMSSYISSMKAMIEARQRKVRGQIRPLAVLVAMKETPGSSWGRLDFADEEIDTVDEICCGMRFQISRPTQSKSDVLSHLGDPTLTVFHFAGHGHTDLTNPSNSKLVLSDWEANGMTVETLLGLNLREHSPFLAYLSACGTGQVSDARFLDESIHIISACQIAGFRHVIGTLWQVNDEACLDIASAVYESLRDHGMGDESVCRGLHEAMQKQRKIWLQNVSRARRVVSQRKGSPLDSSSEDEVTTTFPLWVPYVHHGV